MYNIFQYHLERAIIPSIQECLAVLQTYRHSADCCALRRVFQNAKIVGWAAKHGRLIIDISDVDSH